MNQQAKNNHPAAPAPAGKIEKPVCRLIGTDGNVFSIIGRVKAALKEAGQGERAKEFVARAFQSRSYEAVLALCSDYVDVR